MSIKYTNETLREAIDNYFENPSTIDLNTWDTSEVTNMEKLFYEKSDFNEDISNWKTENVTNMNHMFFGCHDFNQPIGNWNTQKVTTMVGIFTDCDNFNQPLNTWKTGNMVNMHSLFSGCSIFNQPLDQWNTENVTIMTAVFDGCEAFNQPLNSWNTSKVIDMAFMFYNCDSFNQPLDRWDTHLVRNMHDMFSYCVHFNQPLNNWNIENVVDMTDMFEGCTAFERENSPFIQAQPLPQGVAFEIHNAFNQHFALNKDKYFEIIGLPNHPDSIYTSTNIVIYITPKLIELIRNVYPAEEITKKIAEMNQILHTIYLAQELSEKTDTKLLLGKTVDFLVTQPNEFVHFYLEALKYDCLNAYSSGSPISCVKGMIERFYLTMGDTAYALCPDPDTCTNPKYNELVSLFNKRVDKNELTQEWNRIFLEDPIKRERLNGLDKEQRIDHYRQFMIQKYRDAGQIPNEQAKQMVLRDIIEPEIVALDYVFEGLQFGGKKSRKLLTRRKSSRRKSIRRKSSRRKSNKRLHCIRKKSKKRLHCIRN
jgi:surface protein